MKNASGDSSEVDLRVGIDIQFFHIGLNINLISI
jgi:hypothetical protein